MPHLTIDWNYWIAQAIHFGAKLLMAIAFWFIGGWLIRIAARITQRAMAIQKIDGTIIGWVGSAMTITLKVLLLVGILGRLGIEITAFAALLAAVGLAIGAAWSGLLAHMAAGVFLITLRPFASGDKITAAGVTGTVEELGLFTTTIIANTGVRTTVGNNKIFSDNIQNFTRSKDIPVRVECAAQLDHATDHNYAIQLLSQRLSEIPNVLPKPEPQIGIDKLTPAGPVLAVRPSCLSAHSSQVQFDTNLIIREALGDVGFQEAKRLGATPD
jgi:small conductance mechanosensitive channel